MISYFYALTLLGGFSPTYEVASDTTRRALLETSEMKQELVELTIYGERNLYYLTKLTPQELAYAGYLYPIITKKISTKPFKSVKLNLTQDTVIVPELEYDWVRKQTTAGVFFIKSF